MGPLDRMPNKQKSWWQGVHSGMRVTVGMIVSQIGAGHSVDEILADYPYLEREDIMQALRYAAWRAEEREVVLAHARPGLQRNPRRDAGRQTQRGADPR